MTLNVLILGGTAEGRVLAERLAADARFATLLSFAGRTASLQRPQTPHRIGGFGGADGLTAFLQRERFDALVDATHPFAAQMSAHAVRAAEAANLPLIRLARPAWRPQAGDRWTQVATMGAAVRALGDAPRRVFLSIGRTELAAFAAAPQHDYLIRAVDAFESELPRARVIAARGPFALVDETRLLRAEAIDVIVSKNSGSAATSAKLEAARGLGTRVIMVEQPALPPALLAHALDEIVAWLSALHAAPVARREV